MERVKHEEKISEGKLLDDCPLTGHEVIWEIIGNIRALGLQSSLSTILSYSLLICEVTKCIKGNALSLQVRLLKKPELLWKLISWIDNLIPMQIWSRNNRSLILRLDYQASFLASLFHRSISEQWVTCYDYRVYNFCSIVYLAAASCHLDVLTPLKESFTLRIIFMNDKLVVVLKYVELDCSRAHHSNQSNVSYCSCVLDTCKWGLRKVGKEYCLIFTENESIMLREPETENKDLSPKMSEFINLLNKHGKEAFSICSHNTFTAVIYKTVAIYLLICWFHRHQLCCFHYRLPDTCFQRHQRRLCLEYQTIL